MISNAVLALLVALVACTNAAQVAQLDFYTNPSACTGEKSTVPLFLGNKCQGFDFSGLGVAGSVSFSYKYNCNTNKYELYTDVADCSSTVVPLDFATCVPTDGGSSQFSCAEYPDNNLVLLQIGACSGTEIVSSIETVLVVNTCLKEGQFSAGFGATGTAGFYKINVASDKTITYTQFTDEECSQGNNVLFSAKLDGECASLSLGGSGRRLAASGVAVKTAVEGANVGNSASTLGAQFAAIFALIAAAFVAVA